MSDTNNTILDEVSEDSTNGLSDKNGVNINAGNMVMYEGYTYIVMFVDKDDVGWVGHPCANNPNTNSINLNDIHADVEVISEV